MNVKKNCDRIIMSGMEFYGYHGVLPGERELGQPFIIDLEISCDLRDAGESDDLAKTVDYSRVFEMVKGIVTGEPFRLIEALAERIAGAVLADYPVAGVLVRVRKPHAPLKGTFSYVAVEVTRGGEGCG